MNPDIGRIFGGSREMHLSESVAFLPPLFPSVANCIINHAHEEGRAATTWKEGKKDIISADLEYNTLSMVYNGHLKF